MSLGIGSRPSAQHSAKLPNCNREREPSKASRDESQDGEGARQRKPHYQGENDEAGAAERSASRLNRNCVRSPKSAVEPSLAPALLCVLFHESCSGREDRGEREEQSGDNGAGRFGDESGEDRCYATKENPQDEFVPTSLAQRRQLKFDNHLSEHDDVESERDQEPNRQQTSETISAERLRCAMTFMIE